MQRFILWCVLISTVVSKSILAYELSAQKDLTVIGLMSGTSMDGVEVALLKTNGEKITHYGPSKIYPYPLEFRERLKELIEAGESALNAFVNEVEQELTTLHIQAVQDFVKDYQIKDVDLIGFHGHTYLHNPDEGFTVQLGDGQRMTDELKIPVVYDLRANDVKNQGQGTPLAPVYHTALVADLPKPVAIVHIGGVSNVTYIDDGHIVACDTGMGNALIDDWMRKRTGQAMDKDGKAASRGQVDNTLLETFFADPFFQIPPPRSLDREYFQRFLDLLKGKSVEDGSATLTEFTSKGITGVCKHLPKQPKAWYISGGGRYNKTLMQTLKNELGADKVHMIDEVGHDGNVLDAQLFAYLAARSYYKMPISYPGTTGVKRPVTGGVLVTPKV